MFDNTMYMLMDIQINVCINLNNAADPKNAFYSQQCHI